MGINTLKKILLPAIIAIATGIALSSIFALPHLTVISLVLLIFFALCLVLVGISYLLYIFGQQKILWLLKSLRLQEAVRYFKENILRYDSSRRSRMNADLFETSIAYGNLGKFRKAMLCLKGLDWERLDRSGKFIFYYLMTLNLILLEENLELAEKCMSRIEEQSALFFAHLELLKDNTNMADWLMQKFLYEEYMEPQPYTLRLLEMLRILNPMEEMDNTVIEFLIGYFFYRRRQYKSAYPFLTNAEQTPEGNFYRDQAEKFKDKIERFEETLSTT